MSQHDSSSPVQKRFTRRIVLFILIPVLLVAAFFGISRHRFLAHSQQAASSAAPGFDAQARSQQIVAHLNAVIRLYRASAEHIQTIGEPNDAIYQEQSTAFVTQAAGFAFQSAKTEADLIARYQTHRKDPQAASTEPNSEREKLQAAFQRIEKRISDLEAQEQDINKQLAHARPKVAASLREQKKQIHGALDLNNTMKEALQKVAAISNAEKKTGLLADIDRLQNAVPDIGKEDKPHKSSNTPQLATLDTTRSEGVTSQGAILLKLLATRHSLDNLIKDNDALHQQVLDLRTPISKLLRNLIRQGQQLSPSPAPPQNGAAQPGQPATPAVDMDAITAQFKIISAATVPLSQELIVLEQNKANLKAWQAAVDREYTEVLHALLLRLGIIAVALLVIIGGGELWTRAANRYVRDIRRRRQMLIVRRIAVTFLSILVVIFGFVTQFNSLATFAGFITAGIAVGLQTILLSVAAYFFIIGRYGIKVGDRISVASVTGEVIDVGLVRFYLMELAGNGTSLNPTGRVVVFSNAVLFQAGTPLYKQLPGSEYVWHELVVKLSSSADYRPVCDAIVGQVQGIYDTYRPAIERQYRDIQSWIHAPIEPPNIESRLQLSDGVFQLWVRFPVEVHSASAIDEKVTEQLLTLMAGSPAIKEAVTATPQIQSSVRG